MARLMKQWEDHQVRRTGAHLIAALIIISATTTASPSSDGPSSSNPATVQKLPPLGVFLFSAHCTGCHHQSPTSSERAPSIASLEGMTPETLYVALTTGKMQTQAQALSDIEKRAIAEYLGGRAMASAESMEATHMSNRCPAAPATSGAQQSAAAWNGWGADLENTRFQPASAAGLTAEQVPKLKLKWAFGFPQASQAYSQPTVAGGRVYVGSDNGVVYALNAQSGCVYWSFRAKARVRNALTVGPVISTAQAVYFSDLRANTYALDAATGRQLWVTAVDPHPLAMNTGSPALFEGRLYVPVSSDEEAGSISPAYSCCTFRGSVVALDAATGKHIWKTYTIAGKPVPTRKNSTGAQMFAPAGAAVWATPTIDAERRLLYIGTGDGYTTPAAPMTDSIIALQLDSGKILWHYQATANDSWIVACYFNPSSDPCPRGSGPDYDFGTSPILSGRGQEALLIGASKSGSVVALNPARNGLLVWRSELAAKPPSVLGAILFGGAMDGETLYYPMTNGTVTALDLRSGQRRWVTTLSPGSATGAAGRIDPSAAVSVMPGVVFSGGLDGILRGLATTDGHLIWQTETARSFTTVNGVAGHGGSMGGPGPTVVDGMLYVGSGYVGTNSGMPGNVLLAFGL